MFIDPRTLAIGVACCIKGWAVLDFPGSTSNQPSYKVYLQKTTKTPDDVGLRFPLIITWDVWQKVIVPLFVEGFKTTPDRDFRDLILVLEGIIKSRMVLLGYLPNVGGEHE